MTTGSVDRQNSSDQDAQTIMTHLLDNRCVKSLRPLQWQRTPPRSTYSTHSTHAQARACKNQRSHVNTALPFANARFSKYKCLHSVMALRASLPRPSDSPRSTLIPTSRSLRPRTPAPSPSLNRQPGPTMSKSLSLSQWVVERPVGLQNDLRTMQDVTENPLRRRVGYTVAHKGQHKIDPFAQDFSECLCGPKIQRENSSKRMAENVNGPWKLFTLSDQFGPREPQFGPHKFMWK